VLVLALMMKKATGPYWLGPNSDPAYQYLINSLHVLEAKTPSHFEHPGTTLQILGAIVFKSFHLLDDNTTIIKAVLTNPEIYLRAIFLSMLIPFILILIGIGLYSYSKSKSILFACLIQSTGLVFCKFYNIHIIMPPIVNISPEMLIIVASYLCVFLVLKLYFKESKKCLWESIAFGVVCALGFISKTTFIPVLLLPVVLLPGLRQKLIFFITFIFSSIVLTFPARAAYSKMFYGFKGLAINKYKFDYGAAEKGIIDLDQMINNFISIFKFKPFWVIAVLASVIGMIVYSVLRQKDTFVDPEKYKRIFKYILTITLVSLGQILIVSKHYGAHYLIPAISLLGLLLGFYYLAIREVGIKKSIIAFLLIAGIGVQTAQAFVHYKNLSVLHKDLYEFSNKVHKKYDKCQIIEYYRASSKKLALFYGDSGCGKREYSQILKQMYPGSYFYLSRDKEFRTFDKITRLDSIDLKTNCVMAYGSRGETFDGFVDSQEIEFIRNEGISRIKKIASTESRLMFYAAKRFEGEKQYDKAFYAAYKAMQAGIPNINQYVYELGSKAGIIGKEQ
ncbi:MAG: hypothetical protein KJ736_00575, partial [Candidatus Omnitrophica bacterium]|nr:hypothetical protein [Candidatus Omnitrophota bacterium]